MSISRSAAQVAAGLLTSRISGLVRTRVLAHFFGVSVLGDVWAFASRGPNVIQNLLGEQSLSAAFIPVYVRKLLGEDKEEAHRFAGAILALLIAVLTVVVVSAVLLADPFVRLLMPGFAADAAAVADGTQSIDRLELAIVAVRIMFPSMALLVLSAWCLGVLNSHGSFFLAYVAPVGWNAAIIGAVLWTGLVLSGEADGGRSLLLASCWGALGGAFLQLGVQLPVVWRLLGSLRLRSMRTPGVAESVRLFFPALAGRGALQLSSWADLAIASLLATGSVAALLWAQSLYLLPVALFGSSFAIVELPALSRIADSDREEKSVLALLSAFRRMTFLMAPTLVGTIAFGYLVVGVLYRSGEFGQDDHLLVYLVLCAYAPGLLSSAASRLLQSGFFALQDTRRPARAAVLRVSVSIVLGALFGLIVNRLSIGSVFEELASSPLRLGAVGLAFGSAIAAWVELLLLLRWLPDQLPGLRLPWSDVGLLVGLAVLACLPAGLVWWGLWNASYLISAPLVLAVFVVGYGLLCRQGRYRGELDVVLRLIRRA